MPSLLPSFLMPSLLPSLPPSSLTPLSVSPLLLSSLPLTYGYRVPLPFIRTYIHTHTYRYIGMPFFIPPLLSILPLLHPSLPLFISFLSSLPPPSLPSTLSPPPYPQRVTGSQFLYFLRLLLKTERGLRPGYHVIG